MPVGMIVVVFMVVMVVVVMLMVVSIRITGMLLLPVYLHSCPSAENAAAAGSLICHLHARQTKRVYSVGKALPVGDKL